MSDPKDRAYYLKNRDKIIARTNSWRADRKAAGIFTRSERLSRCKRGAIKRKFAWNLSKKFLDSLPDVCFYSGIELKYIPGDPDVLTLDRIDSSIKSYDEDNVVACSCRINQMKSDLSLEEFQDLCESVTKHQFDKLNGRKEASI